MAVLLWLVMLLALPAQRITVEPLVPISVWYPPAGDLDELRRDFGALRKSGFNAVTTWVSWKDGEPARGQYSLLNIDRVIAVASESGLRIEVVVYLQPEPTWKTDDLKVAPDDFYQHVRTRATAHAAVIGVSSALRADHPRSERAPLGRGPGALTPRQARQAMWSAIATGQRKYGFIDADNPVSGLVLALGETAGVITRNPALFASLEPDEKRRPAVSGPGNVAVRILESADAMVIIGVNHDREVRKVTMTFPPDVPEAIWQNMEEGVAVQFVMGPGGPYLEHTFAPEDVLVLAIRKKLR